MSSFFLSSALLAVLISTIMHCSFALDDDFGFDVSEDFEIEFEASNGKTLWNGGDKQIKAYVGKTFHLLIPKGTLGDNIHRYEAKLTDGTPLPSWLLFDKISGTFWGVPLIEDVETLQLTVRAFGNEQNKSDELSIIILESPENLQQCPPDEDNTILTLLIDKGVRAIKPKKRVIAINNIAKFFGLPFSAFTLKSQVEKDDITDSSVVLAGPGNLQSRTSKATSFLQVPVGCDGRLWMHTAPLIHQLKQQARDGTISEVLGLPLIGWRVKTETSPAIRSKRQVDGSGDDYDDYYDEYDDDYDDDLEDDDQLPPIGFPTSSTAANAASTTESVSFTHPHRHHHGEPKIAEDVFDIPTNRGLYSQHSSTKAVPETDLVTIPLIPERSSTSTSTSTTTPPATTTRTTTTTTVEPTTEKRIISTTAKTTIQDNLNTFKPNINTNEEDDYYDEYNFEPDEDDDDPIESHTIIPEYTPKKSHITETLPSSTVKTTVPEIVTQTQPQITTTEDFTSSAIIDDNKDLPTVLVTDEVTANTAPATTTPPSTTLAETSASTVTTTITTTTTTTTEIPSTSPLAVTSLATGIPAVTDLFTESDYDEFSTIRENTVRQIYNYTTPRTTTVREITESIEYEAKNFSPYIENRIQQMSVIAGKIFRFVIPQNTFKDLEDGYNLTLQFLNAKEEPIGKDSWCHFNPTRREIYGLPLEEDVSKWEYVLRAVDREGAYVQDRFTIQVQQHKAQRVVNHEFSLFIRIEKQQEFTNYVDWCLKTLRALGRIYNTNMSEITVRHINYTNDLAIFTWTNDSVPTNHCPNAEIRELFQVLTANDRGDPSRELNLALAPELRVKRVERRGLGVCETPQVPVTPPTNFPPFLRNPVDHINATVGELLIFTVPDDTFYDPEDTDSRTLNISLLTIDRQPIKPTNWLQFDNKNREFYGIPRKTGRSEYQLICVDSAGLPATDSLEVVVYPPPKIHFNVEFVMTVEVPYDAFINSASDQKKFVEKLQTLFGDRNTSYIHIKPFKQEHGSTVISWHNKSLETEICPHEEIRRLETIMKSSDRGISSRVHTIMDPDFPISTIQVVHIGNCKKPPPVIPTEMEKEEKKKEEREEIGPEASSDEFQYLMTFIVPAVIISVMLSLAAIAACVLYRRRRSGKMNVEEDGRQSYGNKGIPVIFQEELEEKPEPGTKAPVILKDEKPPLAPPEYSKSGSLKLTDDSEPYQPPPPFTRTQENGRQPRPKPTPTYRKPPPYVPP